MNFLRRSHLKRASAAALVCSGLLAAAPALRAVQVADGTVFFDRPPLFGEATTTRDAAGRANPAYYFTLTVPEDAGESLQRVVISQRNGDSTFREVEFEPEDAAAFIGTSRRGEALSLGEVIWDDESEAISVEFSPPVPPGTDVALRLEADRNPRRGGVYLFGVTVFPEGELSHGQFIGFGRIHIYDSSDSDFFSRHRRYRYGDRRR
ncbi:MAG: DUF2808 domain-containing protein [Elainellaceae cyanobacterium]